MAVMHNMTHSISHIHIILLIYRVLIQFLLQMEFLGSLCVYNSTNFIPGNNFICLLYGQAYYSAKSSFIGGRMWQGKLHLHIVHTFIMILEEPHLITHISK